MNKDYVRTSPVAPYIDGLLDEKRSLGYSYDFEEYLLNVFDHYCNEHGLAEPHFSREFLTDWLDSWGTESSSYHSQRISFVRQLSLYMNSLGVCSYIPVESVKKETTVPHCMSADERQAFFLAIDSDRPHISQPYAWRMWNEYRIMFRILYCCGLRNSEVCCLKMEDINLSDGILTIRHSKGDKDRIVYLAEDLAELLGSYRTYITDFLGYLPGWAFPARDPKKHVHKATVDMRFNRAWTQTGYADLSNKKPTVHCLRHSFVVDRMNAWMKAGISYEKMLPYLSKHLGHSGISESMYYYHLNEEANVLIREKDRIAGRVIPEVGKYGC